MITGGEVIVMMQFSLLTPDGELYSAQVEEVTAQGSEGELGILPDHISLVTSLKVAPLRIKSNGHESRFAVYGGMLQVNQNKVTILADDAQLPEHIDRQQAVSRRDQLQSQLNRASNESEVAALQQQLGVVEVQLEVVS